MNPNLFLADFGHIANAPEGINRLREMIYNLAVTGALSEQQPRDGAGHTLLAEITAKKQALSNAGLFKSSPKLENLRDAFKENLPKIPSSWTWSRLVEVGEISPKNEIEDDKIASFASMSAISELHSSSLACEDRPWGNIKKGFTHFADGDVVLAKITPCFENGKAAVMTNLTNGIGAGTTELHVVRPITGVIEPGYIYVFLRSPYFKIVGEGHMTGTAGQKRLPTEYFATRPFPLPPLAEQKRIVAKVDELMALCDQLEALQQERKRRFPVLSRTCHARFVRDLTTVHLERIFDEIGEVSPHDLRKTILALAVQGKLVAQDSKDGSAEELFAAIQNTKRELVAAKEIPTQPKLPPISDVDFPYKAPASWKWARLGDIYTSSFYGPRFGKGEYDPKGIPTIRTTDMTEKGKIILRNPPCVRVEGKKLALYALRENDLLLTRSGTIGMMAVFKGDYVAIPSAYLIRFRFSAHVSAEFYYLFLSSPFGQNMLGLSQRSIGVPNVNASSISQFPAPIPPLAEQLRIVKRVDELMALVDHLEKQLKERDRLAEIFAKACVASFTGNPQIEKPGKMKTPKTELVSLVTIKTKPKVGAKAPLTQILIQHEGTLAARSLWQQSGLTIDAFYHQLKTEISHGWIASPNEAEMREVNEAADSTCSTPTPSMVGVDAGIEIPKDKRQ